MSNSIIDQQRDNEVFQTVISAYNGNKFIRNWLTGEYPPEFYEQPDRKERGIDALFNEIQSMLKPDNRKIANS